MKLRIQKLTLIVVLISFLVNLYNIVRFPLFNNAFDPWYHSTIILEASREGAIDLNSYSGFPGLHVLPIYLSEALGLDAYHVIRWFPLFSGTLSTIIMIYFLKYLSSRMNVTKRKETDHESPDSMILIGSLFNTTLAVHSLISSGMFWGQALTASLLPLVLVKFVQVNKHPSRRIMLEYLLLVTVLFFVHHLTSFLLVTFLAFTQLYLVSRNDSSLKGFLMSFLAIMLFMVRYEVLQVDISIISDLTWGRTNFFYLYFVILFAGFIGFIVVRKVLSKYLRGNGGINFLKSKGKAFALISLGVAMSFAFFRYILPYLYNQFQGLSGNWFVYYGSNLVLLAPLAIYGVIVFGNKMDGTRERIVIYLWMATILCVLVMLFAMYLLNFSLGALEFGRLSTFIYPFLSVLSGYSFLTVSTKSRIGKKIDVYLRKLSRNYKVIVKAGVIALFCVLIPFSMTGFSPPPSSTLTRYYNTRSERTSMQFLGIHSHGQATLACDYHVFEMGRYFTTFYNSEYTVLSSYEYYYLDEPAYAGELNPNKTYLILVDEVMLEYSLSYTETDIDHKTREPLGDEILETYDSLVFLDKVYSSDTEWVYQA